MEKKGKKQTQQNFIPRTVLVRIKSRNGIINLYAVKSLNDPHKER